MSHYIALQMHSEEGSGGYDRKKQTSHALFVSKLPHTVLVCAAKYSLSLSLTVSLALQSSLLWLDRWKPQSSERGSLITVKPGYIGGI